MASNAKLSYQRLKRELPMDEYDEIRQKVIGRLMSSRLRRVHIRRKLRVKIPSLKRFLRGKASSVKLAWIRACKRLKESRCHLVDIFAGNYLFMQVTPTPLKLAGDCNNGKSLVVKGCDNMSSSRYPVIPRIAS